MSVNCLMLWCWSNALPSTDYIYYKFPPPMKLIGMHVIRYGWLTLAPLALLGADYDDASQPAYNDGWENLEDGSTEGDGLGGWVFDESTVRFGENIGIETSALRKGGDNIDSDGSAFMLHDRNGQFVELYRFFDPAGLNPGETFSIELIVNGEAGYQGLDLRNEHDQTIFNFNGGVEPYTVSKAKSGDGALELNTKTRALFQLSFQQQSDGGEWQISEAGGRKVLARGEYQGRARSIRLYAGDQGSAIANALFFNRLVIK